MGKKFIIVVLFSVMALSLTGCTKEKKYADALEAYLTYFEETLMKDYDSQCKAKIILDKNDFPILLAIGQTGEGTYNSMIYGYEKGEVVSIKEIHNAKGIDLLGFTDGIVMIEQNEEGEVYQIVDNQLVSLAEKFDKFYKDWNGDTASYCKKEFGEVLDAETFTELGQGIGNYENFYIGKLDTDGLGDFNKDVTNLYDKIYQEIYEGKYHLSPLSLITDVSGMGRYMFSMHVGWGAEYGYLPASEFRYLITNLQKQELMTQDEFYVWNVNFYNETFGLGVFRNNDELTMGEVLSGVTNGYVELDLLEVFVRNPILLKEMKIFSGKVDGEDVGSQNLDELKKCATLYAYYSGDVDIFDKIDVIKNTSAEETKSYLFSEGVLDEIVESCGITSSENLGVDLTSYIDGKEQETKVFESFTKEIILQELLRKHVVDNIKGATAKEWIKSCLDYTEKLKKELAGIYAQAEKEYEENAWKQVYINYVTEACSNYDSEYYNQNWYSFADLNGDSVPEMLVDDGNKTGWLCWIKDGTVQSDEEHSIGTVNWWNKKTKELLTLTSNGEVWGYATVMKFDSELNKEVIESADYFYDDYKINDKPCKKKEYDKFMEKYTKEAQCPSSNYELDKIIEDIKNYQP